VIRGDLIYFGYPEGWVNFFRVDDYAVTSYFYLDKPAGSLQPLASVNAGTE
jgi:hypothetical protein